MFKKLKEKITEEVKSSPQRFQQLTQTVSDKLQGASAPDETMFSIGEDDENARNTSSNSDQGFSSVTLVSPSSDSRTRRLSNSSVASDVSFLPRYEAGSLYHLQSDLDASASELEDNVSQSSSQLGHVSKEQIYSAFQKSQMRYHKYRGRFTDLARHYKELERENAKMKAVLVETQDKAIRRVTELKEQCALEQKAKAHLESALRDELDERRMKIQSLETKIDLLQQGSAPSEVLVDTDGFVDSDKLEQLTRYLNEARAEIEALNGKIQEHKASVIVFQSKEQEYKSRIGALEKDIVSFSEREKENNIKLAENKMELHNELLSKDAEISRLKRDVETLRAQEKDDQRSTKMENLQSQNNKLIEKLENLGRKCNGLESELFKVEQYKMENSQLKNVVAGLKKGLSVCQSNLKSLAEEKQQIVDLVEREKETYENQLRELRESAKRGLFTLEKQISERIGRKHEEEEASMRREFERKLKELSNDQNLAELRLDLVKKDEKIGELSKELGAVKEELRAVGKRYAELETNHLDLIDECGQLRASVNNWEETDRTDKEHDGEIDRLQIKVKMLQQELDRWEKTGEDKEKSNVQLAKENLRLQNENAELLRKVRLTEQKQETIDLEATENNLLEMKVQALEEEKEALLASFEVERKLFNKIASEHNDLKVKEIAIGELEERNGKLEEKIARLKGYLKDKEHTIVELNKLKLALEQELDKSRESGRIREERENAIDMDKTECNLLLMKVQQLENEKESLVKSIEMERELFQNPNNESPREENVGENVFLAKENLRLKQLNDELLEKVRMNEEREQAVELESCECNLLKLKLQALEQEKDGLMKSFELERELFNKTLLEHRELKVKEERVKDLTESNARLTQKIAQLKDYLKNKEGAIVELQKENLAKEREIVKVSGALRMREEQVDALEIEKTECALLEMKVKALEEERENLLSSFETERTTFERALSKGSHIENQVDDLNRKIALMERDRVALDETFQLEKQGLIDSFEVERRNFQLTNEELRRVNRENTLLKEEKDLLRDELGTQRDVIEGLKEKHQDALARIEDMQQRLQNDKIKSEQELRKRTDELQFKLKEMSVIEQRLGDVTREKDEIVEENRATRARVAEVEGEREALRRRSAARDKESEQVLKRNEALQRECDKLNQEISELKVRINQLASDSRNTNEEHDKLLVEVEAFKAKCELLEHEKGLFESERDNLRIAVTDLTGKLNALETSSNNPDLAQIQRDFLDIKDKCDKLHLENVSLKAEYSKLMEQCSSFGKIKKEFEGQLVEMERHYNEVLHEKQLLQDEVQELKISPINSSLNHLQVNSTEDQYRKEIDQLRDKLAQYKSLDVTNKGSIEFYENELQKMKNKNEKLTRKLDETLVTLKHCAELSGSTEIEYLRNVLYNYMLGKESVVLARVIAAVCKFDPNQTEAVLQKEQQKQTLLGQLGIL